MVLKMQRSLCGMLLGKHRSAVGRDFLRYSSGEHILTRTLKVKHNPASTLAAEINSIRKEKTARERLAEAEEALPLVRESCKCLPWFFQDHCLPRHCIGKKSSTDTDPDATRAISYNTSSSDVLARRPQAREMESSNQGSTAQDSSQHHFHSQVSQQKNLQKASDQHPRAGDVNAGSCMSKIKVRHSLILMRLGQGQIISREALLRPRNPFVANRLLMAVSPDLDPSRAWLTLNLYRDSNNGR